MTVTRRPHTAYWGLALLATGAVAAVVLSGTWSAAPREWKISMTQPQLESTVVARLEGRLRVTIDSLAPLRYASGAAPEQDVPAHVRAASAIRRHRGRLVIVQDDVNVLALHDQRGHEQGHTDPVLLPLGPGGHRVFDKARGNKNLKMDLEACTPLPDGRLLVLGSGSNAHREALVLLDRDGQVERRDAAAFYQELRAHEAFAGSELNIEGALLVGDELLLFQRGNGASRGGRVPVNAIGAIDIGEVTRWLDSGGPAPTLGRIVPFELGTLAGVQLGFTDAALTADGRIAVLACAEDSADVIADGEVAGCRFGYFESGTLRMADVVDPAGRVATLKLEGIESRPEAPAAFDVVTDLDNPAEPAMLGRLVVQEH